MTPIRFYCNDEKLIVIDNDELFKCFKSLEVVLGEEGRKSRGIIGLLLPSNVFMKLVEWAINNKGEDLGLFGLPRDFYGNVIISDWDKNFLVANAEMLPEIILAANYLRVEKLYTICKQWVLQLRRNAIARCAAQFVAAPTLNSTSLSSVSIVDAPHNVKTAVKEFFDASSQNAELKKKDEVIQKLIAEKKELEQKLNAKCIELSFTKVICNSNMNRIDKLEKELSNKKRSMDYLKHYQACQVCDSLFISQDLLNKHVMVEHASLVRSL